MRPLKLISLLLSLLLLPPPSGNAATAPRPESGCGVLQLSPAAGVRLVLYREPGVARLAELPPSLLPRLAGSAAAPLVAVSGRSGDWSRIAYDDAGRQGWLEVGKGWQYRPWLDFLPGRRVALLPGLNKRWYLLRAAPADAATERGEAPRNRPLAIARVQGDWAFAETPGGWFRWRDGDGRLTIALPE